MNELRRSIANVIGNESDNVSIRHMHAIADAILALPEIQELIKDAERYQIVRRMNAAQFADAFRLNLMTSKPFDEIIDDLRPFMFPDAAREG